MDDDAVIRPRHPSVGDSARSVNVKTLANGLTVLATKAKSVYGTVWQVQALHRALLTSLIGERRGGFRAVPAIDETNTTI